MKKVLLIIGLCTIGVAIGQDNLSQGNVISGIPTSILGSEEIFRFKPGAITQLLDTTAGADFDFGLSEIGRASCRERV